jgi:hypothetical protein
MQRGRLQVAYHLEMTYPGCFVAAVLLLANSAEAASVQGVVHSNLRRGLLDSTLDILLPNIIDDGSCDVPEARSI